jgi:hypothetical protein
LTQDKSVSEQFAVTRQLARRSHYVPADYLQGWSENETHVNAYRLLVPTERYRVWESRSISGLLYFTDLYTTVEASGESDQLERRLNAEIETPAAEVLEKVRADTAISAAEWQRLAMYLAALDVRTPTRYVEHVDFVAEKMPEILSNTLARVKREMEDAAAKGRPLRSLAPPDPPGTRAPQAPLRTTIEKNPDGPGGFLKVEYVAGRASWVQSIHSNLTGPAKHLTRHRWSILRPNRGSEWFTSDHPVVKLNYYGPDRFDFRGGWGNSGTELFLALSPRHLMYTKVGDHTGRDATLTHEMTGHFQRFIAKRASRWIVARCQPRRAEWFRPRKVDLELFVDEEAAREAWHRTQSAAERWED